MINSALQISLIAEEQIPAAGEMLARAFFHDPLCVYAQPDPEARMSQFTWLFTELIRAGARQRSVYASTCVYRPNGIAVWTPPQAGGPAADEERRSGAAISNASISSAWPGRTGTWRYSEFPRNGRAAV